MVLNKPMKTMWSKLPAALKLFPINPKETNDQRESQVQKDNPRVGLPRDTRKLDKQLKDYWSGA